MATVLISRPVLDAASERDRALVRCLSPVLFGHPDDPLSAPIYTDGEGEAYVFDDHRLTVEDACLLTAAAANIHLADPAVQLPRDGEGRVVLETARAIARGFAERFVVYPEAEAEDVWAAAWEANGSPEALRVYASVPEGWAPVADA